MTKIRKLVLDVTKPIEPSIIELSRKISAIEGTTGVNLSVIEVDRKVENIRVTIIGSNIQTEKIFKEIEKFGGAVHSIDEVAAGKEIVECAVTLEGN